MPRLCSFHGIVIFMPTNDHDPPHFHAVHAGRRARIVIATGDVLPGASLRGRQLRRIEEWRARRLPELTEAWDTLRKGGVPRTIDP